MNTDALATKPLVVIASEPMDDHPDWRLMEPGEVYNKSGRVIVIMISTSIRGWRWKYRWTICTGRAYSIARVFSAPTLFAM